MMISFLAAIRCLWTENRRKPNFFGEIPLNKCCRAHNYNILCFGRQRKKMQWTTLTSASAHKGKRHNGCLQIFSIMRTLESLDFPRNSADPLESQLIRVNCSSQFRICNDLMRSNFDFLVKSQMHCFVFVHKHVFTCWFSTLQWRRIPTSSTVSISSSTILFFHRCPFTGLPTWQRPERKLFSPPYFSFSDKRMCWIRNKVKQYSNFSFHVFDSAWELSSRILLIVQCVSRNRSKLSIDTTILEMPFTLVT